MKFSIALGKTAKGEIKILGGAVDADQARGMVDEAGKAESIVEGYVITNPDRSQFRYRRNFEAPPPPLEVVLPPKPLSAAELVEKRLLESLGASFGENPTSEDIASARVDLQDQIETMRGLILSAGKEAAAEMGDSANGPAKAGEPNVEKPAEPAKKPSSSKAAKKADAPESPFGGDADTSSKS